MKYTLVIFLDGRILVYENVTNFELYEDNLVLDMPDKQIFISRDKIIYFEVYYKEETND